MTLSDARIRHLKPAERAYKATDQGGLYLFVTPAGGKSWRMNFTKGGKQKTLTFGRYPEMGLADARLKAAEARVILARGGDPTAKEDPDRPAPSTAPQFKEIADRWLAAKRVRISKGYFSRVRSRVEHDIYPALGRMHLDEIKPRDVLDMVRAIEKRGAMEVAQRALRDVTEVFTLAVAEGLLTVNPARDVQGALAPKPPVQNRAAMAATDVPAFYGSLRDYRGDIVTGSAMRLLILTWARTGEVRFARWEEIEDLEGGEPLWRIPAERMKMRAGHLVPLSRQAADVLKALRPLTGHGDLIFPSPNNRSAALSSNALLYSLYRAGLRGEATVHGFRAAASTWANERDYAPDVIERCLAHVDGSVRGIYNRALMLPQRRGLLQAWADYVEPPQPFGDLL